MENIPQAPLQKLTFLTTNFSNRRGEVKSLPLWKSMAKMAAFPWKYPHAPIQMLTFLTTNFSKRRREVKVLIWKSTAEMATWRFFQTASKFFQNWIIPKVYVAFFFSNKWPLNSSKRRARQKKIITIIKLFLAVFDWMTGLAKKCDTPGKWKHKLLYNCLLIMMVMLFLWYINDLCSKWFFFWLSNDFIFRK